MITFTSRGLKPRPVIFKQRFFHLGLNGLIGSCLLCLLRVQGITAMLIGGLDPTHVIIQMSVSTITRHYCRVSKKVMLFELVESHQIL